MMEHFKKDLGKTKWMGKFILALWVFLVALPTQAGSIREVTQNIIQVKSINLPFQFAVIGDSRSGEKIYTKLIKSILERKPHFIIHLGDMINIPHEKEWREFFEISKPINLPFFPIVGNHDVGFTRLGEEIYQNQFSLPEGKTYYAFRAGAGLFVMLDSEKGKRKIFNEQWSWLEDTLSSSREVLKLVFIHAPLFLPMGSLRRGGGMDKYPSERDNLHRLFKKTKVKAVFAADDHRYDRMEKDSIFYIITGGGGAPIYTLEESGGYFHYVWISAQTGRMEGEVVDLEGRVRDRFILPLD